MKKSLLLILAVVFLLTACGVCAEEPLSFSTFGEAVGAIEGPDDTYAISSEGYAVAVIEKDGRFFRFVTFLDETGKELYGTFMNAREPEEPGFPSEEWTAFSDHVMALPVDRTEELTVVPCPQEELDSLAGMTLGEVMSPPWEMGMTGYPEEAGANGEAVFTMVRGFCEYELVLNEPFEVFRVRRADDHDDPVTVMSLRHYEDLTVRSVRYSGLSNNILNLRYRADGTWEDTDEPPFENYDLMIEVTDILAAAWENGEPDRETKDAIIEQLVREHPEAEEMIREIVESYHAGDDGS